MENQNKPYWLNESYLEDITKSYNWYSMYKDSNYWRNITKPGESNEAFKSKEEYLEFLSKLKRMIDKVTLELEASRQMEENNKKFKNNLELSK
jgi:hypothetical protein